MNYRSIHHFRNQIFVYNDFMVNYIDKTWFSFKITKIITYTILYVNTSSCILTDSIKIQPGIIFIATHDWYSYYFYSCLPNMFSVQIFFYLTYQLNWHRTLLQFLLTRIASFPIEGRRFHRALRLPPAINTGRLEIAQNRWLKVAWKKTPKKSNQIFFSKSLLHGSDLIV